MELRSRKGFSLLDVLVASMVIGMGLTGVTRVIPICLQNYKRNEAQIYSSLIYISTSSFLKSKGYSAFTVGSGGTGKCLTDDLANSKLGLTGIPAGWEWSYTASNVDGGDTLAKQIDITITNGRFTEIIPCIVFKDKING